MFGLLNSQIYELQQTELKNNNNISKNQHNNQHQLNYHPQQQQEKMKVTSNFIEKFIIKSEVNTLSSVELKNSFDTMKHFKNHNQQQPQQNLSLNNNQNNCNNDGGQGNINDNIPSVMTKSSANDKELNIKNGKMMVKNVENNRTVINRSGSSSSSSNCDGIGKRNNNDKKLKRNLLNGEIVVNGKYKNNKEYLDKTTKDMDPSVSSSPAASEISGISSDSNTTTLQSKPTTNTNSTADTMQRKKFMQMVTFLDQQNQRLEKELAKEKRRRAEELSRIIKSLLCFEAKLKSEKKVINQKLYDKDDEIARLVRLNQVLKKQCYKIDESIESTDEEKHIISVTNNNDNDGEECKYPEALFCPNCRKEFYGLDGKEIGKDGRSLKGEHHHNGSTEHGSSSDETLSSSFYGARRSIRYTSKRTFGTFRDYMRSRCLNIDDPNLDNSEENASTLSRDESQNSYEKMNYSRAIDRIHGIRRVSSFEFDSENENRSRKNFSSSGPETDHDHSPHEEVDEDEVFYPTHKTINVTKKTQSERKINEFTELSPPRQEFETSTDDWYASASDPDDEQEITVRTKSYGYNVGVNPVLECVNQILLQQSMEECILNDNPNSGEVNSSAGVGNNGPTSLDSNDNNSGGSTSGGNLSGGSVTSKDGATGTRKRVHFSTKNSMVHVPRDDEDDEDDDNPITILNVGHHHSNPIVLIDQKSDQSFNYESIYSNEYEPIGSEHNSSNLYVDMDGSKLGQDDQRSTDINKLIITKQPPALPPKPANLIKFKKTSKNNFTPTPDNEQLQVCNSILKSDDSVVKNNNIIEPDYCSISELNENLTHVQIVADVHKIPESAMSSSISSSSASSCGSSTTSDAEIFADIPKLPNVAAIIAPKQNNNNNKFISNDNYVTKSSSPKKDDLISPTTASSGFVTSPTQQQQQQHYRPKSPGQVKRKHVPNILAEINKKIQNSNGLNATSPTKITHNNLMLPISPKKLNNSTAINHQLTPILKQRNQQYQQKNSLPKSSLTDDNNKLPMQEEFDWYNLDAEYGKSSSSVTQSDVIIKADVLNLNEMDELMLSSSNNIENLNNPNDSIEYNLDEEFSLGNQPEEENSIEENLIENNNNNNNDNEDNDDKVKNDLMTTNLENGFATIIDETPNCKNFKRKENFVKFIDTAGLSTKPLPRQRKIYFSGPFI